MENYKPKAGESKSERFVRVAEMRTNKVLDEIRRLSDTADLRCYEYTNEQTLKIFAAVEREVSDAKARFFNGSGRKTVFRLDEESDAALSASAAAEGQTPHRKGQRYYDISADGGNSWTSQWFTEEEVLEELKAGYMLILADSRKHFQK